jgi:hypothetical protein
MLNLPVYVGRQASDGADVPAAPHNMIDGASASQAWAPDTATPASCSFGKIPTQVPAELANWRPG